MLIAGVDEAGRGPVLGPMVLAITVIEKSQEDTLKEMGVKDSKDLTLGERLELYPQVCETVLEYRYVKVEATELNQLMIRHSLNEIEALKIGGLLNGIRSVPELVLVDSPDPKQEYFSTRIKKYYTKECTLRSEHKADSNYLIVGAASIIAKVERDRAIQEYAKKYGEIGSGYSHDQKTISFLKEWLKNHDTLPDIARKRWQTSENVLNEKYQKKLIEY